MVQMVHTVTDDPHKDTTAPGVVVISLCDGMGGAAIALKKLGGKRIVKYYSASIGAPRAATSSNLADTLDAASDRVLMTLPAELSPEDLTLQRVLEAVRCCCAFLTAWRKFSPLPPAKILLHDLLDLAFSAHPQPDWARVWDAWRPEGA